MSFDLRLNKKALEALSPAEQRELRAGLAQLRSRLEGNPLEAYVPYPKQVQFHSAKERYRMFVGGNRSGKSTCGAADDLIQALPPEQVPEHLRPYKKFGFDTPFKGRVITPDLGPTMQVILDKFFEMTPRQVLKGGSWDTAFDKTKRILRFERGDTIDFMSFEQGKDKFGGVALHRVHYDEEPGGPNAWEIHRDSRNRLIDYGGDMVFTMTPLAQTDWVQDMFWEKRNQGRIFGVQAAMRDNPYLSEAEIEDALQDLTKDERRAVEYGDFVAFGGAFYDMFGDWCLRPPPDRAEVQEWTVVCSIDPGGHTGVVWVGFDGDETALVFDELSPKGDYPEQIAEQIKRKNEEWGIEPSYVIDPASRIRSGPNQEQFTTAYARAGIMAAEGQNPRGPGITEVQRRFEHGRLFVSTDCGALRFQISRYRRDPNSQDEWAAAPQTSTTRFDLCDALRYAVMSRTWGTPQTFRTRRNNYNHGDPMVEPPWTGPTHTENPPLGIHS